MQLQDKNSKTALDLAILNGNFLKKLLCWTFFDVFSDHPWCIFKLMIYALNKLFLIGHASTSSSLSMYRQVDVEVCTQSSKHASSKDVSEGRILKHFQSFIAENGLSLALKSKINNFRWSHRWNFGTFQ